MNEADALQLIRDTRSLVFSTRDFAALADIRIDFASQMLRRLAAKRRLMRIVQGLWAQTGSSQFNAFRVVPFLTRPHPAAVSLFSALHLHGMIEQIPQLIFVVSTAMTRRVHTPVGDYSIHKISPDFFAGYEEYRKEGGFLLASPEKALVDCLYFSVRRAKRFGAFPELSFPKNFSRRRAFGWVKKIPYQRIGVAVRQRLMNLLKSPPRNAG